MQIEAAILWYDTGETHLDSQWGIFIYYLGRDNDKVCWMCDRINWASSIDKIIDNWLDDDEDILVLGARHDCFATAKARSIALRPFSEEEFKDAKYLRSLKIDYL